MEAAADPLVGPVPKHLPAKPTHVTSLESRIRDPAHTRGLRTSSAVTRRVLVRTRKRLRIDVREVRLYELFPDVFIGDETPPSAADCGRVGNATRIQPCQHQCERVRGEEHLSVRRVFRISFHRRPVQRRRADRHVLFASRARFVPRGRKGRHLVPLRTTDRSHPPRNPNRDLHVTTRTTSEVFSNPRRYVGSGGQGAGLGSNRSWRWHVGWLWDAWSWIITTEWDANEDEARREIRGTRIHLDTNPTRAWESLEAVPRSNSPLLRSSFASNNDAKDNPNTLFVFSTESSAVVLSSLSLIHPFARIAPSQ